MTPPKKKVLVLCTGNSCRSQMAEGWIRHDLGESVEVRSAGTHPCFVHPLAIQVMKEAGIDLSGHRSKSLTEFLEVDFDLVVTVCDNARRACPAFPGAKKQRHIPIPDPVVYGLEGDFALEQFRQSRDLIRRSIVPAVEKELDLPSGDAG
ncbi:MAG: arsenate reductase ArsC [Acidobacteriota bacterium]